MEQEIVPTSPKAHDQSASQHGLREPARHLWLALILITLVLGTGAGMAGFVITTSIPQETPVLGQLNVISLLEQERQDVLLSTRRQDASLLKQSPAVIQQIGSVYAEVPSLDTAGVYVGNALSLTSDGWMVMPTGSFDRAGFVPPAEDGADSTAEGDSPEAPVTGPVVVLDDGSTAAITQALRDEITGLTFFRVDADGLSVVRFADTLPAIGQSLSLIDKRLTTYTVYEQRVSGFQDVASQVRSTQSLHKTALLDPAQETAVTELPAFFNNGAAVGMIKEDGTLVPAAIIASALQDVIEHGEIRRPAVEMAYVNLARVADPVKQDAELPDNGIYLSDVGEVSGLAAGDVVTAIDGVLVDARADFAFEVQSRRQGDTMTVLVVREGEEFTVDITL